MRNIAAGNMEVVYHEAGTRKLLRKYPKQITEIRRAVESQLAEQLANNFSKTKIASRLLFAGCKVYECRVNLGLLPPVRVGFIVQNQRVTVVFMSNQIQKSDFSRAIDKFLS
ncbi:hypothetical protein RQN30_08760 [Arcanobacterium hippocoleae]